MIEAKGQNIKRHANLYRVAGKLGCCYYNRRSQYIEMDAHQAAAFPPNQGIATPSHGAGAAQGIRPSTHLKFGV
ncbi:MAG TPA: hypothetical protein VK062_05700 [Burkholderiaceae bacterium]|nr:hypothetical protein [Burkholderiaceae bacterium]